MTMSRHENRATPKVVSRRIYTDDAFTDTVLDSPAWFAWLATATTFFYEGRRGTFTAHREHRQRGTAYWTAYRRQAGILHRLYLGKTDQLTLDRLEEVSVRLAASFARKGGPSTPSTLAD